MKPSEEQWNRWIDGTLSSEEAEALAAAAGQQELSTDQAFFSRLSQDLKETFPSERTPPFADFFNSHLQKQIRDLREEESRRANRPSSWLPEWFRLSWALPLAGAAALVITLLQIGLIGQRTGSRVMYAYTPDDSVTAITSYNADVNGMVIRLEGMDPLPDEFDLLLATAAPVDGKAPARSMAATATEPQAETAEFPSEVFVFVGPHLHRASHSPAY